MNKTNLTMKFSETNHRWTNYDIQLSKKSFDTLLKQMMNSSQIELIFDEKLIKME